MDQREYWNGPTGLRWVAEQQAIDASLKNITAALMPFAAPAPGMKVLEIGCGCGSVTAMLARAVAPGGTVLGVDISAPMLAVARGRAVPNVTLIEADASAHEFAPEHDLVFSRFGVMFFSAPAAAFANIAKGLKPGGRLAFVCWRALAENPWAAAPIAAVRDLLPPEEPVDPHAPGPYAFADGARVAAILGEAGYRDIAVHKLDCTMEMGATADEAAGQALNLGPLARAAAALNEDLREKIRARVVTALEKFATPTGIAPPAACWLVEAKTA